MSEMTEPVNQVCTAYRQAQIMTASPEQLVLILYDSAKLNDRERLCGLVARRHDLVERIASREQSEPAGPQERLVADDIIAALRTDELIKSFLVEEMAAVQSALADCRDGKHALGGYAGSSKLTSRVLDRRG